MASETARAALAHWEATAQRCVAVGEHDAAADAFANLARWRLLTGDSRGALAAADAGLRQPSSAPMRTDLMVARAQVLDCLDDSQAAFAWTDAGVATLDTALGEQCIAHATGAMLKQGIPALETARILLSTTRHPTAQHRATLLGALGESAGYVGVPYLIQAVVTMRDPGGFTASTVGYWAMLLDKLWVPPALAERLAPYRGARATDVQLGICGIGIALLARSGGDEALCKRVIAAIERCGAARATALEAMLSAAETYVREHDVWSELRTLGEARGAEHWLL